MDTHSWKPAAEEGQDSCRVELAPRGLRKVTLVAAMKCQWSASEFLLSIQNPCFYPKHISELNKTKQNNIWGCWTRKVGDSWRAQSTVLLIDKHMSGWLDTCPHPVPWKWGMGAWYTSEWSLKNPSLGCRPGSMRIKKREWQSKFSNCAGEAAQQYGQHLTVSEIPHFKECLCALRGRLCFVLVLVIEWEGSVLSWWTS